MTKTITKKSPVEAIKAKVQELKKKKPKNWKSILIRNFPEYNTMSEAERVNAIMAGRSTDVLFTERLEKIVNGEIK